MFAAALAVTATVYASPGTTYWSVGAQYGVSWQAVEADNPWPATAIPVGAQIRMPGAGSPVSNSVADHEPDNDGDEPVGRTSPVLPASPVQSSSSAPSGFRNCVRWRESSGNASAWNGGHYGLYQFSAATWAASGGNPADFGHASVSEQDTVFNLAYGKFGTSPWAPYDGC